MSNTLAVKALNQYRQRDVFAYLALRYYVSSVVGWKTRWIDDVCTRLVRQDNDATYQKLSHFKERNTNNKIVHRDIYLPSPSEMLAEISLITELSKDSYPQFHPRPFVYSYRFAKHSDKSGVFKPYFNGLKERQRSIAAACKKTSDAIVLYTDIKKFYPSIRIRDAIRVWEKACDSSGIEEHFKALGLTILSNHAKANGKDSIGHNGLLTGPLFSHVIANLLMDEIDDDMHKLTNGNYWRYVDDIVLVGEQEQVTKWRKELAKKCEKLGLHLHDGDKDFSVNGEEWLTGEFDFDNKISDDWAGLIANVKRFLLAHPSKMNRLMSTFQANNIRIPILDYSKAIMDSGYLRRTMDWLMQHHWAKRSVRAITVESLLEQAIDCRDNYFSQIHILTEDIHPQSTAYGRKRNLPKIRFFAGRLAYLLSHSDLLHLNKKLRKIDGLELLAEVINAIATDDFSDVVQMGPNVTHAAARLKIAESKDEAVKISAEVVPNETVIQSLATLRLNGLLHNYSEEFDDALNALAAGNDVSRYFSSDNKFIREFACLCGTSEVRHKELLDSCFDRDESLAMDLLVQIRNSSGL